MSLPEFPARFNLADYFLFDRLKEGRGNHPAILFEDQSFTYAQVAEQSRRAANALRAAGVKPGERVLICLPDGPDFAFAWFGAIACGAVGAMVNPILPPKDYAYYLEYTEATALVVDAAVLEKIGDVLKAAKHLKAVLVSPHGFAEARAKASPSFETHPTKKEDPASGSSPPAPPGSPRARSTDIPTSPSTPRSSPSAPSA